MILTDELYRAYGALWLFEEPALRIYVHNGTEILQFDREFRGIPISVIAPQSELYASPVDTGRHGTLMGCIKVSSFLSSGTMGAIVQHRQSRELLGADLCPRDRLHRSGAEQRAGVSARMFLHFAGSPLDPADAFGDVSQAEGAKFPTPTFPPQVMGVVDAAVFRLDKSVAKNPQSRRDRPRRAVSVISCFIRQLLVSAPRRGVHKTQALTYCNAALQEVKCDRSR